jgi:hypothetical protein
MRFLNENLDGDSDDEDPENYGMDIKQGDKKGNKVANF